MEEERGIDQGRRAERREPLHRQRRERRRNEARRRHHQQQQQQEMDAEGNITSTGMVGDDQTIEYPWGDEDRVCDPLREQNVPTEEDEEEKNDCGSSPGSQETRAHRWSRTAEQRNSSTGEEDGEPVAIWRRSPSRRKEPPSLAASRGLSERWSGGGHGHWLLLVLTGAILLLLGAALPGASAGTPKYETAYACEGKTLMVECEHGDLIKLIRANYGRFSITICNDHGNVEWSVNCMSPKSLRVLHSKCAQKQNCSVLASTSMFGDPCPGTHKYLEAHYQCVSAEQSSTTTNRPSPPWLKTSQPIVWSTSTVRNPVLSRLNLSTTELTEQQQQQQQQSGVIGTTVPGISSSTPAVAAAGTARPGVVRASQSSPTTTFRNKGFENKSVNDDLAIIKTIADRKKQGTSVGSPATAVAAVAAGGTGAGGSAGADEEEDGADLFPTQTAVLSGAAAPPAGGNSLNNNNNQHQPGGGGGVHAIDVSHACGPSTARNLFWNVTRVGEVNVQPCPGGATGIAKWRCVAVASLTPEQRLHLQQEQLQNPPTSTPSAAAAAATPDDGSTGGSKGDISFSTGEGAATEKRTTASTGRMAAAATWYGYQPDLTQCRSLWLNNLEVRVQQPDSSLISIANDLAQVTSSKTLYGGDMLVATKLIQTMSHKMHFDIETLPDQRQREALVFELLNSVVKTGSNLLDRSQHASWLDLSVEDQMRVATSLLTGLEDNAFLLADTILREKHVVQKVKNILISIRVLETRNFAKATELFPDSSTERWQVSSDQIELPKAALIENSEGGLVRIVFVAFDRLEQILRPQFSNIQSTGAGATGGPTGSGATPPTAAGALPRAESSQQQQHANRQLPDTEGIASANVGAGASDGGVILGGGPAGGTLVDTADAAASGPRLRLLNSKVISASLGKGRHIQLSQPIRMILRHLRTKNVSNPTCVFWNYIDHAWSEDGCHVEHTNLTHTVCMCNHLTNFALLVDAVDDETQLSLLSNIDDSMLLYIGVAIVAVITVVALFARKLCNGAVLAKLHRHGPEEAGMRAATDRDGGLSISAAHHAIAGARMMHHHHPGPADLHHPALPAGAAHHHHHLAHHHHLPPGLAGTPAAAHHLLVADDFLQQQQHQQQQQTGPISNLHNHHPNNLVVNAPGSNNHLVTTTFNNLNGGGGSGTSSCSPSPPGGLGGGGGGGYADHHLPAHLARLNNNVNVNLLPSQQQHHHNLQPQQQQHNGLTSGALVKPLSHHHHQQRPTNNQIHLLRAAQQQQQQQHQQQQQQQQQQHHQPAQPPSPASSAAPPASSSLSAAAAAAATSPSPSAAVLLQQQQQQQHHHHLHHHQSSQAAAAASAAAAAAAGAPILLQGFGVVGGGGGGGGGGPPPASPLIASTSLITAKGTGDEDGSDQSSAAEMVSYNLGGGHQHHPLQQQPTQQQQQQQHHHHHQGSIGSNASSSGAGGGLLVVAGGGGGGGAGASTLTSSASSSASASVPLLQHHHHHHHSQQNHLHQHLHDSSSSGVGGGSGGGGDVRAPIPSKRNLL